MASTTPSTRFLTKIPPTQPSCGAGLTLDHPIPTPCNSVTTTTSEAMGCFLQVSGLLCAPLATTRGFLYTLNGDITAMATTATATSSTTTTTMTHLHLLPRLSVATVTLPPSSQNQTNPPVGIDGLAVLTQGPARLGQTCVGIPLMTLTTDPVRLFLIEMANQQLKEMVGSPGIGAGMEVLNLRGDCEAGTYCDLNPSRTGGSGASSSSNSNNGGTQADVSGQEVEVDKTGVCKEQLPNYHSCSSYMECLSLRCDSLETATSSVMASKRRITMRRRRTGVAGVSTNEGVNYLVKRKVGAVCLPPKHDHDGSNESGDNHFANNGTHLSSFPMWTIALIVVAVMGGVLLLLMLSWKRKRQMDRTVLKEKGGLPHQIQPNMERIRQREWERTLSSDGGTGGAGAFGQGFSDKESAYTSTASTSTSISNSTRVSSSFGGESKMVLPRIMTTLSEHQQQQRQRQLSASPAETVRQSFDSTSSSSSSHSPIDKPRALSPSSNLIGVSAPPSPLPSLILPSSPSHHVDRFQDGEMPIPSNPLHLLYVSGNSHDDALVLSSSIVGGRGGGIQDSRQYSRANSTSQTLVIPTTSSSLPSSTSSSLASSSPPSPQQLSALGSVPISPISPISPGLPLNRSSPGGSSRLASRSSYQMGYNFHRKT